MFVVWKRPDGFHGATPTDFYVVELGGHTLWLHKKDTDHYPFRISGGWREADQTKRLNNLVNLLGSGDDAWLDYLVSVYENSMGDEASPFFEETISWLNGLKDNLKGDNWEVDAMAHAISALATRLQSLQAAFLKRVRG